MVKGVNPLRNKFYAVIKCTCFRGHVLCLSPQQSVTLRDMVAMTTSEILVCRGNRGMYYVRNNWKGYELKRKTTKATIFHV